MLRNKRVKYADNLILKYNTFIRNTELLNTPGSSQPAQLQTAKSQENANTVSTISSGSLTIDPRISSPSSVLSQNSVSLLDGLLSQQSCAAVENTDFEEIDQEVSHTQDHETCHSYTSNGHNILKSSLQEINANCPPNTPDSRGAIPVSVGDSNDMFSELQKSQNHKCEIRRTPEIGTRDSERVPASVESDSQSYKVIPLPRYEEYSGDGISPEFLGPDCPHKRNCSDDFNPIAEKIATPDKTTLSSKKEQRFDTIQTEQYEVASVENIPNRQADNIKNPDPSGSGLRQSKRKRSPGENVSLKCPRLSDERRGTSKISIEKNNEIFKHDCDDGVKSLQTNQRRANSHNKLQVNKEVRNASWQETTNQLNEAKISGDTEDDIIPPTPPVRVDHEGAPPKNGSNNEINKFSRMENVSEVQIPKLIQEDSLKDDADDGVNKSRTSRLQNTARRNLREDEIVDDDVSKNDTCDDGGCKTSRVKNNGKRRESVCQDQDVDEYTFNKIAFEEGEYETARPKNITAEKESPRKNEMLVKDDLLENPDNEGELMIVNERSPIMEDDQSYFSQEDLNIALLRRLGKYHACNCVSTWQIHWMEC